MGEGQAGEPDEPALGATGAGDEPRGGRSPHVLLGPQVLKGTEQLRRRLECPQAVAGPPGVGTSARLAFAKLELGPFHEARVWPPRQPKPRPAEQV